MNAPNVEELRPIVTPQERCEADGLIMDALLAGADASISADSSVRATHVALDAGGAITLVRATVTAPNGTVADQVFSAP